MTVKEKHFKYFFELIGENERLFYTADGFIEKKVENGNSFFYPAINEDDIITMPKWAEGEIIYQVFVDRFFNGNVDKSNSCEWKLLPKSDSKYGGDFEGIISKLDYIQSLGVKILYMSPVFKSPTNHKYDIEDYYQIDEMFGGKKSLKKLVACAHSRGIKVVLDCVFNHMSSKNAIFQDVVKRGEHSPYKDWFYIESYPINEEKGNYDTFANVVPSMPRLNTSNDEVIEYLVKSSVYWTKELEIDGWRLDVTDEVSCKLWKRFRIELQKVNKDILIIGEIWNHATKWMDGDQIHTFTNYKYRKNIIDFALKKCHSESFWQNIERNKMLYKTPVFSYLINLVGSHDTSRIATVISDNSAAALIICLTLCMDGMPLIYYGDEILLEGREDPDNRRPMPWEETENEVTDFIKQIGMLRSSCDVLKKGSLTPILMGDRVLAFQREYKGERLTVIANFGEKTIELLPDAKVILSLNHSNDTKFIQPKGFVICK